MTYTNNPPQDTHFRDAFANIFTFDHHVGTQTDFWADAFGGGKKLA